MVMTSQAHVSIHGCLSDTPVVVSPNGIFLLAPAEPLPAGDAHDHVT